MGHAVTRNPNAQCSTEVHWSIGVDFDNTIIDYSRLFVACALDLRLIEPGTGWTKQRVRDHIRARHGDPAWCDLQAEVYGARIVDASPMLGCLNALRRLRDLGAELKIVSHKTERAVARPNDGNLRDAARGWLAAHGFTTGPDAPLTGADVHFESTRGAKVRRIAALGCTHFVDDLVEVFEEPEFPGGVERLLFGPPAIGVMATIKCYSSWPAIEADLAARAS